MSVSLDRPEYFHGSALDSIYNRAVPSGIISHLLAMGIDKHDSGLETPPSQYIVAPSNSQV